MRNIRLDCQFFVVLNVEKEVYVCKHFYIKLEPLEFHCIDGALPNKETWINLKNKKSLQYDSL